MVPDFTLPLAPSNFTCSSSTYPKKADVAVAGVLCFVTEILLNFALSTSYEFTNHNSTLKKSYDRSYVSYCMTDVSSKYVDRGRCQEVVPSGSLTYRTFTSKNDAENWPLGNFLGFSSTDQSIDNFLTNHKLVFTRVFSLVDSKSQPAPEQLR